MKSDLHAGALDDLFVGQSRVLTDAQIASLWGGIDPQFSPDNAAAALENALSQEEYEQLFQNRIGTEKWHKFSGDKPHYNANQTDYYSYNNLLTAVKGVANLKYKVEYRQSDAQNNRVFRLDKETKTETLIYQNDNFSTSNIDDPIVSRVVDFGSFINEGSDLKRKHEMAAFLANISHETGIGLSRCPDNPLDWGLYWNEEISYINTTTINYVEPNNNNFPPVEGKSYHGRGPIQLSWNYNYGLISGILYGTKDTLLQQPELIVNDGSLGFMTAILFWMTPEPPNPSAHDVMVGNWTPSKSDISKGLTQPGFGITIMIINGYLEGNLDETDRRINSRIGFYRKITTLMGISIEGEKLNTLGMSPF